MLTKKLGIVTQPSELDEQDTFFPFVNEAISRPQLAVYVFNTTDLSRDGKSVMAKKITAPILYKDRNELNRGKTRVKLGEFGAVFLKKDPPIDAAYLRLAKMLAAKKIPTINSPKGILAMGTKAYLRHFPVLTPKTYYVRNVKSALAAIKKLGNCILKQSDSYGGKGVIHLNHDGESFLAYDGNRKRRISDKEAARVAQVYLKKSRDGIILLVEYLTSASKRGDKRVVILGYRILGSYIRLPNPEKGICMCANAGAKRCPPTKRDHEILQAISPHLKKHGIDLAALDLLVSQKGVEYLSEINVVNPGFCNLDVVHPELHIAKQVIDTVEKRMK